jgi:hypothetical protein
MNILEKLKIKCPVEIKNIADACEMFYLFEIRIDCPPSQCIEVAKKLLIKRKEWEDMLEDLIGELFEYCQVCEISSKPCAPCKMHTPPICQTWHKRIQLIEKLTKKSWSEIKGLLEGK